MALSGCSSPDLITDKKIGSIFDEYERQSAALEKYQADQQEKSVHLARIENPTAALDQQRVSVNLQSADLAFVLQRLGINYSLIGLHAITAHISMKFDNLPMQQALDLLLLPAQLKAEIVDQYVTIQRLPENALKAKPGTDFVFKKQVLRYADTRMLEPILSSLLTDDSSSDDDYNSDSDSDSSSDSSSSNTRSLSFAAIHSENAILVKGSSADVNNALDILRSLDTDNGHILIEALVLEFSAEHLMQIGTKIASGASGEFSDVSIDWASLIGETIAFTNLASAANTRTFRAAISLLIQHNYARVISRPYLATISGKEAKIEVVEDRYVTTFTENSDEITLQPVTSGISLTLTPFLLPDEQVRLDLEISASQFVPNLDNVSLARTRSDATSTVRIGAGQTLVIGGLMALQSTNSDAGIPGAREVPGLGFLFGEKKTTDVNKRVLIYITPYLWRPGLETPVDSRVKIEQFMKTQEGFKPGLYTE